MRIGRAGSPATRFAAAQLNQIRNRNATAKIVVSVQRDRAVVIWCATEHRDFKSLARSDRDASAQRGEWPAPLASLGNLDIITVAVYANRRFTCPI
jgi:hypothetical protein